MADDRAGAVQVCRIRIARLDAGGAPDVGADNAFVSDTLISLVAEPEVKAGEDLSLPNGCGDISVAYVDDDRITRLNLTARLTKPDPSLVQMMMGGEVFTQGGDVTGYKYPRLNTGLFGESVSVEVWSKAIVNGQLDDELPYWWSVLPLTKWRPAGRTWENAARVTELVGQAFENDSWGNGPFNDWNQDSDRVIQDDRTDEMPDAVGLLAIPAS